MFTLPAARPGVIVTSANGADHRRQIAQAVNRINEGHFNCSVTVTLTPNAAQTTVTDSRISPQTCAALSPQTAHAAAEIAAGGCYVVCATGTLTISHANNAQTDRVFVMAMVG